jgi:outer membrane protein assembly factor BamE (lipoprotein component of BamABCDE complex)
MSSDEITAYFNKIEQDFQTLLNKEMNERMKVVRTELQKQKELVLYFNNQRQTTEKVEVKVERDKKKKPRKTKATTKPQESMTIIQL